MRLVQFAFLVASIWIASASEASAAGAITLPLPQSVTDLWSMLPAGARTFEFWAGLLVGLICGEAGRYVWRTATSWCSAGVVWVRYGLTYGGIAIAIGAVILFL